MTRSAGWRKAKNGQDDVVSGQHESIIPMPLFIVNACRVPAWLPDSAAQLINVNNGVKLCAATAKPNTAVER